MGNGSISVYFSLSCSIPMLDSYMTYNKVINWENVSIGLDNRQGCRAFSYLMIDEVGAQAIVGGAIPGLVIQTEQAI